MKINGTLLVDLEVEGEDALTSERKIKIDNLQIAKVQQKQRISSKNKISDIAIRNRTRKQQIKMKNNPNQSNNSNAYRKKCKI